MSVYIEYTYLLVSFCPFLFYFMQSYDFFFRNSIISYSICSYNCFLTAAAPPPCGTIFSYLQCVSTWWCKTKGNLRYYVSLWTILYWNESNVAIDKYKQFSCWGEWADIVYSESKIKNATTRKPAEKIQCTAWRCEYRYLMLATLIHCCCLCSIFCRKKKFKK